TGATAMPASGTSISHHAPQSYHIGNNGYGLPSIGIPPTPPPHDYPAPSPRAATHGRYSGAPHPNSSSSARPMLDQQPQQENKPTVLQKNRKFTEAYEEGAGGNSGSSGAARRVMDFFRKRGLRREKAG